MVLLQVKTGADLFIFDKPDDPSSRKTIVATINEGDVTRLEEISRTADGVWVKVKVGGRECFVKAADVEPVTDLKPIPVDLFSFVDFCTVSSETFNQKQATTSVGVSRDYILALALVLNGLEDSGLTDEVLLAFDPFHFIEAEKEWKAFCDSSGNTSSYQDFDRFDPFAQIDAAVFFTFQSTSAIDSAFKNLDDGGGPYIPNSMDLFLVHMLGDEAGVAALKDLATDSSRGSKPWASFVSAGGNIEALKTRYPNFLAGQGMTSVDQVLGLVETAFDKAYVNVAKIVPGALPEDLDPAKGPPKWLERAREEAKPPGVKRPDGHIVDYFTATDFGPGATPTTAWCGAFAAFCMNKSGMPVPKGAARASSWGSWGKPLSNGTPADQIPLGAVVVFSPLPGTTGSSGHVAFFVSGDQSRVRVLGGNQGPQHVLNEENFPRIRIHQIRLPADSVASSTSSTMSTAAGSGGPGGVSFEAKAPGIMDKLMADFQLSESQAAGVLGNIGRECAGFQHFQQLGMPPGTGGFGWCQWTGSRRTDFENFCDRNNFPRTSDEGNFGFLKSELQTSENAALRALQATATLEDAVVKFEEKYERAGVKAFGPRIKYAQRALDAHRQGKANA